MNGYRREITERYNQMLDDCYEDIDVCGMMWSPSTVLYRVDPIAYRCGINDWLDSLETDGLYCSERELFSDEFEEEE